jgi:hypothetical protein
VVVHDQHGPRLREPVGQGAEARGCGRVEHDHDLRRRRDRERRHHELCAREEPQHLRDAHRGGVRAAAERHPHLLAEAAQGQAEGERRTEAVGVGVHVRDEVDLGRAEQQRDRGRPVRLADAAVRGRVHAWPAPPAALP